jgi:hypothetical protein
MDFPRAAFPAGWACLGLDLQPALGEFLLQGPISAFIGALVSVQSTKMYPLPKISVVLHAECWYRPVSGAKLPTDRAMPRAGSGFTIVKPRVRRFLPVAS